MPDLQSPGFAFPRACLIGVHRRSSAVALLERFSDVCSAKQERGVSVFYWIDGRFGYALSGEIEKSELLRIAKVLYQQLNP